MAIASSTWRVWALLVFLIGISSVTHARLGQRRASQADSFNVLAWEAAQPGRRQPLKACQCSNYTCSCCEHLEVPSIKLNTTGCAKVSYLPEEVGIAVVINVGQYVLFNDTISAKNPPPICTVAPYFEKYAQLCLKFHDLALSGYDLHACLAFEAYLLHVIQKTYELGCVDI